MIQGDAKSGAFRPNDGMTRAELATVLDRLMVYAEGDGARKRQMLCKAFGIETEETAAAFADWQDTAAIRRINMISVVFLSYASLMYNIIDGSTVSATIKKTP